MSNSREIGATNAHPGSSAGETRGLETLLPDGSPAWSRLPFDLLCPRCAYNLRGLPSPRCPECGLAFEWRVLLQRRLSGGDFLFEHNWRWQPVRSFVRTLRAAFAPKRFWQRVSLYDPVRTGALLFQLIATVFVILATMHAVAAAIVIVAVKVFGASAGTGTAIRWWIWPYDEPLRQLWTFARWPLSGDLRYILIPAAIVSGLLGIGIVLYLMHQTLGRCRVRKVQILRVTTYVAAPVCAYTAVLLLVLVASSTSNLFKELIPIYLDHPWLRYAATWQQALFFGGIAGNILLLGVLLSRALSDYLRLPRARIVGMTTAVVAASFSYTLMLYLGLLLSGRY